MQTQTMITRRIAQTTAEDLHRLAGQAEAKGVQILVDHRTGAHVATSASDPTRCYQVDAVRGCTCRGYAYWGRCQHHSLLLAELGRLPEVAPDIEPTPAAAALCPACRGEGWVKVSTGGHLAAWVAVSCRCTRAAA